MRKNVGTNKTLAARRHAREIARQPVRRARREQGEALKLKQALEVAQMNRLFKDAMRKRREAEARGEKFENDVLTDLTNQALKEDNEQDNHTA